MWLLSVPRMIAFGEDSLNALATINGKKALIVTDNIMRKLGYINEVTEKLSENKIEVEVFDGVEAEPSEESIYRGLEVAKSFQPDLFVAIGGGSSIDTAKTIWVLYERPDKRVDEISPLEPLGLRKKARLVAIPTTSGTGSESTWAMVITKGGKKLELASREVLPDLVILDPRFVYSMPKELIADTGIDALTHAIEAYTSTWRNEYSDALSEKAVEIIMKYLPKSYRMDKEAMEKVHYAADMAGIAFSNSQIGIIHALAHSFGATFHKPHGRSVALFLPYGIKYNSKAASDRYKVLAGKAGIGDLYDAIINLLRDLNEPLSVKDLGITEEEYFSKMDELVSKAMESTGIVANPRMASDEECKKIFEYAYYGKEVDF
ncbi:MAG: iron-containing alcohol dehydrogenase [Caldisphaeraceae archaeon]|nr:iron-containing alcohol dehydrogenase [Caldisphaeraceae archaeon]